MAKKHRPWYSRSKFKSVTILGVCVCEYVFS